jgi:hypothetical protein
MIPLLIMVLACNFSAAHQEVPLTYDAGKLTGLPSEFEPATFDEKTNTLNVGAKKLLMPETISRLFIAGYTSQSPGAGELSNSLAHHPLKFFTSLHHGPSMIPPYLKIRILPQDEKFWFDIYIDLENLSIMKAEVELLLKSTNTLLIPIMTNTIDVNKNIPSDWRSIIGEWRFDELVIRITEDSIVTTEDGEGTDYPNGTIKAAEPGMMVLTTPSGKIENFSFKLKGDILELNFERAPGLGLFRLGGESEKIWKKRIETDYIKRD